MVYIIVFEPYDVSHEKSQLAFEFRGLYFTSEEEANAAIEKVALQKSSPRPVSGDLIITKLVRGGNNGLQKDS
jgi:hypothetical protein